MFRSSTKGADTLLSDVSGKLLDCGAQINDVVFSSSRPEVLACANHDGYVRMYDWKTETLLWENNAHNDAVIHAVRFITPVQGSNEVGEMLMRLIMREIIMMMMR